jgi:tRNA (guanine10-N2)-dimethyltransferase
LKYYTVFSGPDYSLALVELQSLLEAYNISSNLELVLNGRIGLFEAPGLPKSFFERHALVKEAGEVYGLFKSKEEMFKFAHRLSIDDTSKFKVDSVGFEAHEKSEIDVMIGKALEARGFVVDLKKPENIIRVINAGESYILGKVIAMAKARWVARRPRIRPFFHPSVLHPKLARLMVNLSMIKEGKVLLDTCAGTGSILIEGEQVNAISIGLDLSKKMVYGCSRNIHMFAPENAEIILADARKIPLRKVDAVATDPPYGRSSSNMGIDTMKLREDILKEVKSIITKGGLCVMMSPSNQLPQGNDGLELKQRHNLYVHSQLTRTISIFRRV